MFLGFRNRSTRIRLSDERRVSVLAGLKKLYYSEFGEDLSDFQAEEILSYFIKTLGPSVYNQEIADARAFLTRKLEDLDGAFFVNVIGARNVMRSAVELDIKKVVHTRPQCVRSHYDHDFDVEDVPRAPGIWQYGLSKMLSYEICRIYSRVYGIQTVC